MKLLLKLLFWSFGLGVVALAGLVILITTIDPNEHKGWIEARLHEQTGREISLAGPVSFTLYPWLGLEAAEVSIANTDEFGAEAFAYLDYIKLRAKSLPLLREEYEVDTVIIRGAVINLVRNEQGSTNWDDLYPDENRESDGAALPLAAVALGGVAIEEAKVTLEDRQAALRREVSDLDVSTAELKYGEPVDISLSFHGRSDKPALDATVSLSGVITYATDEQRFAVAPLDVNAALRGGNIPGGETALRLAAALDVNLDEETAALSDFTLSALDARVSGNLRAEQINSPGPVLVATLDAQGPDLGLLFKVAEIEPLASQLAGLADRSFQVSATVGADLEQGNIDLSELSAKLLGAAISGELQARAIHSDTPGYQGELNAEGPDLPTLLQVLGQLQGGQDAALTAYGRKLAAVPTKAFQVTTAFDADLKSGDVSVPTLSLEALGIVATGALDARDMQRKDGTVSGRLNVKGEQIGGLLKALDEGDLAQVLQSVELDARVQGSRAGVTLEPLLLEAVFAGPDIPGSPAPLTLNADTRLNLDQETLAFDRFTLAGLGLETTGQVEFTDIFDESGASGASGQLQVAPFNLRRLAQQLRWELPDSADADTFTRVALSGQFDRSDAGLNLENLALQLDDMRLSGRFSISDSLSRPSIRFDLNMNELDLDRYLPPDSPQEQDAEAGDLPIAALFAADMEGDLSIDRLTVAKARLDGFRIHLQTGDGIARADPVTASLYEGELSTAVSLDVNPGIPVLSFNSSLTGIQAEPLLMDLTGEARLRGKGDFTAALNAEGTSIDAMKRSLNGAMSIRFTEGAITGFNLGRTLHQWKQFKKGRIVNFEDTTATDFTEFTGNPVARDGVIRMDDLSLKAPAFRLQGEGVLANLHTDTIDYQAQAIVVDTSKEAGGRELAELRGLALPLQIVGPLDDPQIRLVWEHILARLLVDKVIDALDLQRPGAETSEQAENEAEAEQQTAPDPVRELLKQGLKEGLKGIFGD